MSHPCDMHHNQPQLTTRIIKLINNTFLRNCQLSLTYTQIESLATGLIFFRTKSGVVDEYLLCRGSQSPSNKGQIHDKYQNKYTGVCEVKPLTFKFSFSCHKYSKSLCLRKQTKEHPPC